MKIGRNKPCWCGSGKKYKKCHYGRQKAEILNVYEVDKVLKSEKNKKDCCVNSSLRDQCEGGIIRAHTVTRATSLKKISRDNHVYGFQVSVENLVKNNEVLYPSLIGIKKASTFTGFCKKHDDVLFSDIEKKSFNCTKREWCLHAYRALVREYFTKRAVVNLRDFRSQCDSGRNLSEQLACQLAHHSISVGSEAGLRDIEKQKVDFEKILSQNDYADLNALVIKFDKFPSVLGSGGKFLVYCFDGGQRLQNLSDLSVDPSPIYYNVFCSKNNGYFIFTWLKNSDQICRQFVESFRKIKAEKLTDAIIRFLFSSCENIYIAPTWWEALSDGKKDKLVNRLSTTSNLKEDYKSDYLFDDKENYDDWVFKELIEV